MTWFGIIKGLTPKEKRQTIDFWPKESRGQTRFWSGFRDWPKEKKAAALRLRRRHIRESLPTPTAEDLEAELKNPTYSREFVDSLKFPAIELFGRRADSRSQLKDWKENIKARPTNYNKIKEITLLLNGNNIPINRQSILEELVDFPTNKDNEAIEFVLREMQQ